MRTGAQPPGGALYAGGKPNARWACGNVAGYGGAHGGGRRGGSAGVGNVAGYGSASAMGSVGAHRRSSSASPSPSSPLRAAPLTATPAATVRVPTPNGGEVLLTRRHFLYERWAWALWRPWAAAHPS
ncbi:MAG: hypothetical protein ACLSVD_09985 [Eggerthellaceae bacterium]